MRKFYGIVGGVMLLTTAITGCANLSPTAANVTHTTLKTQVTGAQLTKSKITSQLEQQGKNHAISNIHIITLKNVGSRAYAFVSFDEDGKMKYANVFHSSSPGTGMGIFSAPIIKGSPIQAVSQIGENGYSFVTGIVVDNPNIKNIVIIFADGDIRQLPVHDGQFYFFGQIGKSGSDANQKHLIGITDSGEIVI